MSTLRKPRVVPVRFVALACALQLLALPACAQQRSAPQATPPAPESKPVAPEAKPAAAAPAAAAPPAVPVDTTRLPAIDAAALKARVTTLSSDAMGGRATGSPESLKAAQFLADQLKQAGIGPAGDDGTYLQTIDWVGFAFDGPPELAWTGTDGKTAQGAWGPDFDVSGGPPGTRELQVVVATADKDEPQKPRADVALMLLGKRMATQHWLSASGSQDGAGWGALLTPGQPATTTPSLGTRKLYRKTGKDAPLAPMRLTVRGALRDALEAHKVSKLVLTVRTKDELPAVNVVGKLPGAGLPDQPTLGEQCVVFSAHYDHLGTTTAPPPDPAAPPPDLIYNGADDDASGCAAVLALADAFGAAARSGRKPARTLVFLLATGEERGLLGTDYYLDHPVVALDHTTMDLNFEMIGRADPLAGGPGHLWLTGFERSALGADWARSGLPISPDARPDEHFFERSDNYAFVQRKVPGQTLSSYNLHEDYHTVADEVERVEFAHMDVAVRAGLAAAMTLADGSVSVGWVQPAEEKAEKPDGKGDGTGGKPESKPAPK